MIEPVFTLEEAAQHGSDAGKWHALLDFAEYIFNSMSAYAWVAYGHHNFDQGEVGHARDKVEWHKDHWRKRVEEVWDSRPRVIAAGRALGKSLEVFARFSRTVDEWATLPEMCALDNLQDAMAYEEALRSDDFYTQLKQAQSELQELVDEFDVQRAMWSLKRPNRPTELPAAKVTVPAGEHQKSGEHYLRSAQSRIKPNPGMAPGLSTKDKIVLAIRKLHENPRRTAKDIADELGMAASTLSKSDLWKNAVRGISATPPPKGVRRSDGTVEAEADFQS